MHAVTKQTEECGKRGGGGWFIHQVTKKISHHSFLSPLLWLIQKPFFLPGRFLHGSTSSDRKKKKKNSIFAFSKDIAKPSNWGRILSGQSRLRMGFGELELSNLPHDAGVLVTVKGEKKRGKKKRKPQTNTHTLLHFKESDALLSPDLSTSQLFITLHSKWAGVSEHTPAPRVCSRRSQALQQNLAETQMHPNTEAPSLPSLRKSREPQ